MADMIIPEFLKNQSFEAILSEMIGVLPSDIDTSEGSHPYNLLAPTAYEKSQMAEFIMVEALKLIFPQFCGDYDEYVDYHAENCGMTRKVAEKATGEITIKGKAGTSIPAGSRVSTVSLNGTAAAIEFETTEDAVIDSSGSVTVPIAATLAGSTGNVSAGTIILLSSRIDGVSEITNGEPTSGGLDAESSEALITRIIEYESAQGESFVGNVADYKRWALEVPGTGAAQVIDAQDGTGLVTLIITDANGNPATKGDALCLAVYNHIMSPNNPDARLAPCGAALSVVGPTTLTITVAATVNLDGNITTLDKVKEQYLVALKQYLLEAANDGAIIITKVGSELSQIDGVIDYTSLKVNGGTTNVSLPVGSAPLISAANITLTEA